MKKNFVLAAICIFSFFAIQDITISYEKELADDAFIEDYANWIEANEDRLADCANGLETIGCDYDYNHYNDL